MSLFSKEVDVIIGRPFKLHGRGPDYFDCIGVVLWLFERGLYIKLIDPLNANIRADTIKQFSDQFIEIHSAESLQLGDIIYFDRPLLADCHVAIVENHRYCVGTQGDTGVLRDELNQVLDQGQIKFYRPKQLK